MAKPKFNPSQPFEAMEGRKPKFDPSRPFNAVAEGPQTGAGEAALESFGNAASLGYLPQLQAMAGKFMPDPNADLDARLRAQGFNLQNAPEQTYIQARDENLARQELQRKEHPIAAGAGTVAGLAASGIAAGGLGAVAKGASGAQRLAAAAKSGGALGGLANPGDVAGEIAPLQLGDRAKNAAVGAALGTGGQLLAEGAGVAASKVSRGLADKAALKAARAVGRPSPVQGRTMAKSGEDIALGRELLDQGAIPVLGTSGRIAKRVDALKEKSWQGVEQILARGGDGAVVDGAEAGMRILNSPELSLLREAGETHAVKALEEAADQLAQMGNVSLSKAQQIKRTLDKQLNYNKAIPDMTGGQAARFEKRTALRDQMDAAVTNLGGGKGELKAAFKKHGLLEKASDIAEKEAGRLQANRALSLTDTIAGAAGAARGEPLTALALAAANKLGRTFGNSVQARSYDAVAKALMKIPKLSAMAEKNPSGFAALVERMTVRAENVPVRPQFADVPGVREVASEKPKGGPDRWAATGLEKLGIQDEALRAKLLQSKEGKRLLIEASDLSPGSPRMKRIREQIQKLESGR